MQRCVKIREAASPADAAATAQREFERLRGGVDWRLYADLFEQVFQDNRAIAGITKGRLKKAARFSRAALSIRRLAIPRGVRRVGAGGNPVYLTNSGITLGSIRAGGIGTLKPL